MWSKNFLNGSSITKRKPWQMSPTYEYTYTSFHEGKRFMHDLCNKERYNENILRVTTDANLNFNCHLENVLKNVRKKNHVLAWIKPCMSIPKRKLMINSVFTSQFNYWPLTWSVIAAHWTRRLIDWMEGASALYTVTRYHLLKNY